MGICCGLGPEKQRVLELTVGAERLEYHRHLNFGVMEG